MDPNAVLKQLREAIAEFNELNDSDHECRAIIDGIVDLDEWLTRGGFLPQSWDLPRHRAWLAQKAAQ